MAEMPKMRGHHLICLHFFSGKGYDQKFISNLRLILEKASHSGVEIVTGADDICVACIHLKNEKCSYSEQADDEIRKMDRFALRALRENVGSKIQWNIIKEKIPSIFPSWAKKYCKKCTWEKVCEEDVFYKKLKNSLYAVRI